MTYAWRCIMCEAIVEAHAREGHLWSRHQVVALVERMVRFFSPAWN